jgi:predicted acyltransferase
MSGRDITLDVVRGLTVFEMETVNNSDWSVFDHASVESKTITYADTIFPTFSFLSGMHPMPVQRGLALVGLGLAHGSLSVIQKGKDFTPRYVGVLQRHGLANMIFNATPKYCTYDFPILATSLWTILTVGLAKNPCDPLAKPEDSAQTKIDKTFFPEKSLYIPSYDPEGLLGSLTTAVTIWLGSWYATSKFSVEKSAVIGVGSITAGYVLSALLPKYFPISKPYWSPSFALIAGGWSILKCVAVSQAVPFLPECVVYGLTCLGKRSIEVFFSSALLQSVLGRWSLWQKAKACLTKKFGPRLADFTLVGANNALMVFLAIQYVKYGLKIKF